jgi:Zn finger protein HypA/HybF involved in hydrogenase expression
LRQIGLAGIIILIICVIVSGATYLGESSFIWNPGDPGFIYSTILTLGFVVAIGAGIYGSFKEMNEFLIAAGTACIALALVNKLFSNVLYSWSYLDIFFLVAGFMMILDSFHVKRVKEAKKLEETKPEEPKTDKLLEKLDKLESETESTETETSEEGEIFIVKRQLWSEAKKKPELLKGLRDRLYNSPIVQDIVSRFINSNLEIIEPIMVRSETPSYPVLSDLKGYSQRKIQYTLNELVESGILNEDLYEKLVACPQCHQSSKVFNRSKCPECESHKVKINRLMQHLDCGAIYKQNEYLTPTGITCPKCGKRIEEENLELKSVGISFECQSCNSVFSEPLRSYYCRGCSNEFQLKNCDLLDIHSFTLNQDIRYEAKEKLTIITIAEALRKKQYSVDIPGYLKGRTGVNHEFTITAKLKEKLVAIDLVASSEIVDTKTVLSSYAKFTDNISATSLLIAMPMLHQEARDFLKANNIQFIEGENMYEITDNVIKLLESTN